VWRDVHVDLTTHTSELAVQAAMGHRGLRTAKAVQHVPKQCGKAGTVQPITIEPTVSIEGGVGVVVHLSKGKGEMGQHFIHRIETTTKLHINLNDKS
jgi:hypothetical protein